jgi:UDP-N-acetylmuramate: L-alanyl-gamma-D-glutamyl-meso-diaminopimelate ligase
MNPTRHVHFIGICGTAMGAVAAAMRDQGFTVSGSDQDVYPPMSTFLENKGISISRGYSPDNLPATADLIVVGNAISRGNPEVEEVLNRRLNYVSLPETLRQFFLRGRHNTVVTGTHGKTTTTTALAWILSFAEKNPAYLIGGIPKNLPQGCSLHPSQHVVLEGDEYDTAFFDKRSKFLHYLPEVVLINNLEFDHADIFQSLDEIKLSFRRLMNIVPENGLVIVNADDRDAMEVASTARASIASVGFSENADHRLTEASYGAGASFTFHNERFEIQLPGEFNVRNAAMAATAALHFGVPIHTVREALSRFEGVKRRQEVRGEVRGITVIDDFGHHPTAIHQTLQALRHQYPDRRIWAIFEPRSNTTRRAVFQQSLPAAFENAYGVVFSKVARLEQLAPEDRLDPEKVISDIATSGKPAFYEPDVDAIIHRLQEHVQSGDVIAIFSNGGFDNIHKRLLADLS